MLRALRAPSELLVARGLLRLREKLPDPAEPSDSMLGRGLPGSSAAALPPAAGLPPPPAAGLRGLLPRRAGGLPAPADVGGCDGLLAAPFLSSGAPSAPLLPAAAASSRRLGRPPLAVVVSMPAVTCALEAWYWAICCASTCRRAMWTGQKVICAGNGGKRQLLMCTKQLPPDACRLLLAPRRRKQNGKLVAA